MIENKRSIKEAGGGTAVCIPEFGVIADEWLAHAGFRLKPSSYAKYFNIINNHIKPALGKYAAAELTNAILGKFAAKKLACGENGKRAGLAGKTVTDIFSVIKSILRYAESEYKLPKVSVNLRLRKEKPGNMRIFTKEEQAALEKYLCSDTDESKLGVLLCIYTGLRLGEICALKWRDISLPDKTLSVRRTMQRIQVKKGTGTQKTEIYSAEPKSACSYRIIPLQDWLVDILLPFCPGCSDSYFLTGTEERFVEPRTYQNRFRKYIRDCGIKHANFHTTRHTFATRCAETGFEIKSLSIILGHSNVNITLNRYVHPSFEAQRENMNMLRRMH